MKQTGSERKALMASARAKRNALVQRDMDAKRTHRSSAGASGAIRRLTLDEAFADAARSAAAKLASVRVRFSEEEAA